MYSQRGQTGGCRPLEEKASSLFTYLRPEAERASDGCCLPSTLWIGEGHRTQGMPVGRVKKFLQSAEKAMPCVPQVLKDPVCLNAHTATLWMALLIIDVPS